MNKELITKIFLKLFILTAVLGVGGVAYSTQAQAVTYYVASAPEGNDQNDGSINLPWATFNYRAKPPAKLGRVEKAML